MPNLGDKDDVQQENERIAAERGEELADLAWIMSSPRGRRVVHRWIEFSGIFGELFSPNGSITSRNLGRRDFGIALHEDLELACPDLFLLMRREHNEDKSK